MKWQPLALLLLAGLISCSKPAPSIDGPNLLSFEKPKLIVGRAPQQLQMVGHELVRVQPGAEWRNCQTSLSQNGGLQWDSERQSPVMGSLPEGVPYTEPKLLSVGDALCILGESQSVQEKHLLVLTGDKKGEAWQSQSTDYSLGSRSLRRLDAGSERLLIMHGIDGLGYSGALSDDQGKSWQSVQGSLPKVKGYEGWQLEPLSLGLANSFQMRVDGAERVHLLIGDAQFNKGDQEKKGLLYYRSEDGRTFEHSQFWEGKFPVFGVNLGENSTNPDLTYRCYVASSVEDDGLMETSMKSLYLSISKNGGSSWEQPQLVAKVPERMGHPQVAGHGEFLVCSWLGGPESKTAFVCASGDGGRSWSKGQDAGAAGYDYRLLVGERQVVIASKASGTKSNRDKRLRLSVGERR